eukprot:1909802-Rhodomonas_salina.1
MQPQRKFSSLQARQFRLQTNSNLTKQSSADDARARQSVPLTTVAVQNFPVHSLKQYASTNLGMGSIAKAGAPV